MSRILISFLALWAFLGTGGCQKSLPLLGEVPHFSLTDQRNRPVGKKDLLGKIWVVDFIYAGCGDVCPLLSQKMKTLQETLRKTSQKNSKDVLLISLTVDPEQDTPQRLAEYGEKFQADPEKWLFLTGETQEIQKTIVDGFKTALGKNAALSPGFDIFHSDRFVLVDQKGRIRGYYETNPQGLQELVKGIECL